MQLNTPASKASKGTVQIISSNNRLQLRFRFGGKRHYLSIGLPNTPVNRKAAEQKANQIYLDIVSGNFDPTLSKYKPKAAFSTVTPDPTPQAIPNALDLWEQYREYRASSLKLTTKSYHEALARILEKILTTPITDALKIKAELKKIITVHQTKRILTQLSALCRWATKHGLLDSNPYQGMASELPKYRYQLEPKPNAFTEEERDQNHCCV